MTTDRRNVHIIHQYDDKGVLPEVVLDTSNGLGSTINGANGGYLTSRMENERKQCADGVVTDDSQKKRIPISDPLETPRTKRCKVAFPSSTQSTPSPSWKGRLRDVVQRYSPPRPDQFLFFNPNLNDKGKKVCSWEFKHV